MRGALSRAAPIAESRRVLGEALESGVLRDDGDRDLPSARSAYRPRPALLAGSRCPATARLAITSRFAPALASAAYFLLHGGLVLSERALSRAGHPLADFGRAWVFFWVLAPLPLLFHLPFLAGVIWPLIGMPAA